MLLAAVVLAVVFLLVDYTSMGRELDTVRQKIRDDQAEKTRLEGVRAQVEAFKAQKAALQQRINVIEQLQRNRSGGQDLLQMVANTVVKTDSLWLTKMDRKGNALDLSGTAASIDTVANFLSQLKRSGYFTKIELKEVKENDITPSVATYEFSMTAEWGPPSTTESAPAPASATPASAKKS
ncbi:MAG: PilN domain-containing protein [Candidatus Acidiferrales bacterium]